MLRKLYVHEFKALLRWLVFVWVGIVAIAIINRLMNAVMDLYIESNYPSGGLSSFGPHEIQGYKFLTALSTSLTVLYALATVAGLLITFGLVIVRFYKNLFTSEGYFTFSIPVSANQHLWCKLICGGVAIMASLAVCALSLTINFLFTDVGKAIAQVFYEIRTAIEIDMRIHLFLYAGETILILIASILVTNLTAYCSISFGQSFKNKIGGSVISYIIIKMILNCATTFLTFFFGLGGTLISFITNLDALAPELIIHLFLLISLLIQVILGAVFFLITSIRTSKKLNLE